MYYSPHSQWPAGFLINFEDVLIQRVHFSTAALSPEYTTIQSINFNNFVHIDINVQGGKQSDDSRPISTTISAGS